MSVSSPQDVYARLLVSGRGYPLWTPEPNTNLPDVYIREGLKIGDVGVVVPRDGSFDVLFNVCFEPTDEHHQETGVPDNFTPITLNRRDIAQFPEAEPAGRIISTSSVSWVSGTEPPDGDPSRCAQPGPLNYEFILSSREGAVLIMPEGAERCYLLNESLFRDEAIRHAVDWYTFAEQRLGRSINHDSLYLITGLYKTRSWSVAAYKQGTGTCEASAQFKAVQVGRGDISTSYTWQTTHSMDWRVGPSNQYYNGKPNQTVFIEGFKIAIREDILGRKRVNVKVDNPSVRSHRVGFSGGSFFSNLWRRASGNSGGSTANIPGGKARTTLNMDTARSNLLAHERDNVREDITIHRFPQITKPFHPSDIINRYLLQRMPSATVAVTHDSQWAMLLERGLLNPEELSQEDHVARVISNYPMISTHKGAVYLQGTVVENDTGADASIFSEGCSGSTSTPLETLAREPMKIHKSQSYLQRPTSGHGRSFLKRVALRPHVNTQLSSRNNQAHGSSVTTRVGSVVGTPSTKDIEHRRITPMDVHKSKSVNVILFGETGTGKRVVNLIAKKELAEPSSDANPYMQSTRYNISFDGIDFCIFNTSDLGGPSFNDDSYPEAIVNGYKLIQELKDAGGIHLVLCCIPKVRMSRKTPSNSRLFFRVFCQDRVPVVLITTDPGESEMEDWWWMYNDFRRELGLQIRDHVCITTHTDLTGIKYATSRRTIRALLKKYHQTGAFKLHETNWLVEAGRNLTRKEMERMLSKRLHLDPVRVKEIVGMMERSRMFPESGDH